jgi:hypothetical protein
MFKISNDYATRILTKLLHTKEILNMSHHSALFTQLLSFIPRHGSPPGREAADREPVSWRPLRGFF